MIQNRLRLRFFISAAYAVVCLSSVPLGGCSEDTKGDDEDSRNVDPSNEDDDSDDGSELRDAGKNTKADGGTAKPDGGSSAPRDAGRSSQSDARAPVDAGGEGEPSDSGTAMTDGAARDAGSGPGDASAGTSEDLGEGDGKDVITIGDSWMLLASGTGIEVSLEKASGRDYRNYGVPGTRLLNEQIPGQYESAKREDPNIKTVVMTGGGNDILQEVNLLLFECPSLTDACKQQVDMVAVRLESLWAEMAKDGVRDVIIVGYTRKALDGDFVEVTEYSNMKIQPVCDMVPEPLRCHTLDSDTAWDGSTMEGIHPTNEGYDAIGKAVWELMQKEGMRR